MATAQECFTKACKVYDDAMQTIETLGNTLRRCDIKFSDHIAKQEFDLILQCILIEIALSDGDFSRTEAEFIDKITDRGDILVYIHDKYMQDEKQFSWDSMYHSDPHVIQKLSDVMDRLIQDRINDFIGPFATLDAVLTNVDICKTFTDYLISIGVTLAAADGYISQEEEEAIKRRIYDVFFENWQECLRRLKTTL